MKVFIGNYPKTNKGKRSCKVSCTKQDTWSLDSTLAPIILVGLKKYKKLACSKITWGFCQDLIDPEHTYSYNYPLTVKQKKNNKRINMLANKKMVEIIDKMIFAFEYVKKDDRWSDKEAGDKAQEGLELFGKYYMALWW